MKQQQTLAMAVGFEKHAKRTRRAEFLEQMNAVVPWRELVAEIDPFYPRNEGPGRPPVGLERMLRMYFLQQWFNLSDPGVEEALYESLSMRHFVGIDLGSEPVPDETTVCKFRHLLERHGLGAKIFSRVNGYLESRGVRLGTGTIVDATLIEAPSSTKNKEGKRDPGSPATGLRRWGGIRRCTRRARATSGISAWKRTSAWMPRPRLVHTVIATVANVADVKGAVLAERAPRAEDRICLGWPSNLHVWPEEREADRVKANPLAGGACVRRAEAALRLRQGALPQPQQEPPPAPGQLRAGQPAHRKQTPCPAGGGVCLKTAG